MEAGGKSTTSAATPVLRPRQSWLWFVVGFLLVFVGMLLLVSMTAMHPSGQYAVQYPLWQYYAVGLRRLFGDSNLGPASGGTLAVVETGLFHLLFSAIGGFVFAAVGWYVRRLRSRTPAARGDAPDRGGIT
jgi:hypothetical protein